MIKYLYTFPSEDYVDETNCPIYGQVLIMIAKDDYNMMAIKLGYSSLPFSSQTFAFYSDYYTIEDGNIDMISEEQFNLFSKDYIRCHSLEKLQLICDKYMATQSFEGTDKHYPLQEILNFCVKEYLK